VRNENRRRGLAALEQSKDERRRALTAGRVRLRGGAPQFWLWTIVIFVAFGVVYWNVAQRQLQTARSEVMGRQRAIKQELEPRLLPLRDKLEAWVVELGGAWTGDHVDASLAIDRLSRSNGIYLRLLEQNAHSPEEIRKGMEVSLHDGFTSCLFQREERYKQDEGKQCHSIAQCDSGQICNDWNLCAAPSQPFNLRMMYRGLRVLSPSWSDDLHQAGDDYQVRVFSRDLDKAFKDDVPIAIEMITRAKYFTVVLDETPKKGFAPASANQADAGLERDELRVQLVPHPVRVGIWDLTSGQSVLRMRVDSGAEIMPIGRSHVAEPRVMDAQQRQANNCGIALDVKARVEEAGGSAPNEASATSPAATSTAPGSGPAPAASSPPVTRP
jgi:hypothetical protein